MMHVINTKYHFTQLQHYSIPMYVCMYVCMYLCMYLCIYVCNTIFTSNKKGMHIQFTRVAPIGAL